MLKSGRLRLVGVPILMSSTYASRSEERSWMSKSFINIIKISADREEPWGVAPKRGLKVDDVLPIRIHARRLVK